MMHKEVKIYMDDMIIKSRGIESHVEILHEVFERLRKYNMKLNIVKCMLRVKFEKLLG